MDGVGGTVKNVIFQKVKSGQVVINSPQEFSEVVKTFVLQFILFTCPKAKTLSNLKESKVQERSRKRVKYTNKNERSTQIVTRTSIFTRLPTMRSLFMYNGMEARKI